VVGQALYVIEYLQFVNRWSNMLPICANKLITIRQSWEFRTNQNWWWDNDTKCQCGNEKRSKSREGWQGDLEI